MYSQFMMHGQKNVKSKQCYIPGECSVNKHRSKNRKCRNWSYML